MSYHFPHKTRNAKKEETIQLLTNYLAVSCDILKDVSKQIIIDTPLLKELIALPIEHGEVELTLEQWRNVCIQNGWERTPDEWLNKIEHAPTRETFKEWTKDSVRMYQKKGVVISYEKDLSNWWHWFWWDRTVRSWDNRLQLIKDASFNLKFLEWYDDYIYSHEAFLILMGISSDKLDREEFRVWFHETVPQKFIDYPQIEEYGLKQNYTEFDEWKRIKRRFSNGTSNLYFKIHTKTFIKWAIDLEYIEEDTYHHRDDKKAPYDEAFAKMLYDSLTSSGVIRGRFEDKWSWLSNANSLAFLVEILHENGLPYKWHSDNTERSAINWNNILHYIQPQSQSPLRNLANYGKNGVKDGDYICQLIDKLLEDYEGYKLGRKDKFVELQ